MGYEYKLDFEVRDPNGVEVCLRRVAGFEVFDSTHGLYTFRRLSTGAMPDAHAAIEKDGVYLCDNGGARAIVDDIRASLAIYTFGAALREL